jgi:transcriptional regulator with XRE-family HTH domain
MGINIGGKIKQIRKNKRMTQNELAKKSGVAQSTLSYIENNDKHPHFETLSAICKGLDVSVLELLSYGEKENRTKMFEEQLKSINADLTSSMMQNNSLNLEKYLYEKLTQTDDNIE